MPSSLPFVRHFFLVHGFLIQVLHLFLRCKFQYPEGYLEAMAAKEKEKEKGNSDEDEEREKKGKGKRKLSKGEPKGV